MRSLFFSLSFLFHENDEMNRKCNINALKLVPKSFYHTHTLTHTDLTYIQTTQRSPYKEFSLIFEGGNSLQYVSLWPSTTDLNNSSYILIRTDGEWLREGGKEGDISWWGKMLMSWFAFFEKRRGDWGSVQRGGGRLKRENGIISDVVRSQHIHIFL